MGEAAQVESTDVEAELYGFFEPGFEAPPGPVSLKVDEPAEGMILADATPTVCIHDARKLQGTSRLSEAAFFERYGFVLLEHASAVEDWDVDPATPEPENSLTKVYGPETEAIIRSRLFPGRRMEMWQGPPTRRGPGTPNPGYALGVHQDFGRSPDDFQEGLEVFTGPEIGKLWRARYDQADVAGFLMIDFWRTAGMQGPLKHMPLTVCDTRSVKSADVVPLAVLGITPTGRPTNQLSLRYDAGQRWYYYPDMAPDEVLALKNFQYLKGDPRTRLEGCYHSAFEDPRTPADAEIRQSSEHRVNVFLLGD